MFKTFLHAIVGASLCFSGALLAEEEDVAAEDAALATAKEQEIDIKKLSEAFGNFIGKNIKSSGLNLDVASLIKGIQNGSEGKPSPMSEKEYEKGMMALQQQTLKKLSDDNLKAANAYMEQNAKKAEIKTLEPGKLQYAIISQGTGEAVKEHGTPIIKYKGSYIDGTVFGNSDDAGGQITLPLDQTIPGFSKAIVGMKEGEKRQIFVHPDLGYGTSGHLPPNSLLIFEVELIKAQAPEQPATSLNDEEGEDETPIAEVDVHVKQTPPADTAKKVETPKDTSNDKEDSDSDENDQDTDDSDDEDDDDNFYDDEDDEDEEMTPSAKNNKK